MNLTNDVSIARSLELITEQDTFKKRNVDMRRQRTFQKSRPSHRHVTLPP